MGRYSHQSFWFSGGLGHRFLMLWEVSPSHTRPKAGLRAWGRDASKGYWEPRLIDRS
jgi:hypothetical protein